MIRALRVCAIALVGLVTSAAAAAPTTGQQSYNPYAIVLDNVINIPEYRYDERKFSKEDPALVDEVQFANEYVNTHMKYVSDTDHYGVDDLWVMAPVDGKGDCEDAAMTKLYILENSNLADVTNSRISLVLVHWKGSHGEKMVDGHAILAFRFPHGSVAYLDINNQGLMTKAELEVQGVSFQNW